MTREAGVGIHIAPADVVNVWHVLRCRGGTEVTVTGNNVDAAAQPIITVTVVVTRFNSIDDADDVDAATTSQTTVTSEVLKCDALYQSIAAVSIRYTNTCTDVDINERLPVIRFIQEKR